MPGASAKMAPEDFYRLGSAYLERATASMPPTDRFTDKMLSNIILCRLDPPGFAECALYLGAAQSDR